MKLICIIYLIYSTLCLAQDEKIVVSNNPTNKELVQVFAKCDKGEINIYDIISQIVEKSNNSVPGLSEYLFTEYE